MDNEPYNYEQSMREQEACNKKYNSLKSAFFEEKKLERKLAIIREALLIKYVHEDKHEELATFAEIVMRQCRPGATIECMLLPQKFFECANITRSFGETCRERTDICL